MKTVGLHVGDRLKVIQHNPFGAPLQLGEIVTVVGFDNGDSHCKENLSCCPIISDAAGEWWFTNLKELFHNYKKVGK